ncbi:histone-lysine N-methyltransferase MLL [Planoprotostelium fungivorum]|uniref:Histone-lysine N-methyltransferase MLL n=1 Tax=Planoprotostelium fungivorum TaxID=1890364 RepID=A0A2P6N336_9EUKA|nr:histone-lysine N-methyltransferase MLL [Planoprotostelium fungivorum]
MLDPEPRQKKKEKKFLSLDELLTHHSSSEDEKDKKSAATMPPTIPKVEPPAVPIEKPSQEEEEVDQQSNTPRAKSRTGRVIKPSQARMEAEESDRLIEQELEEKPTGEKKRKAATPRKTPTPRKPKAIPQPASTPTSILSPNEVTLPETSIPEPSLSEDLEGAEGRSKRMRKTKGEAAVEGEEEEDMEEVEEITTGPDGQLIKKMVKRKRVTPLTSVASLDELNANKRKKIVTVAKLGLTDALKNVTDMAGWSEARVKAWNNRATVPNAYYFRFNEPGEEQKTGPWTAQEKLLFKQRMEEVGVNGEWGLFSRPIPGRVGYQCASQFRKMVQKGEIKPPAGYVPVTKKRGEKGDGSEVPREQRAARGKKAKVDDFDDLPGSPSSLLEAPNDGTRLTTTPTVWYSKDKSQEIQSLEFCYFCGSFGGPDSLISCVDCGESYHQSCFDPPIHVKPEYRFNWRCPNCKFCEVCKGPQEEDKLLVCELCDSSIHTFCLDPPLSDIPDNLWLCRKCGVCAECGSTKAAPNIEDNSGWITLPEDPHNGQEKKTKLQWYTCFCQKCGEQRKRTKLCKTCGCRDSNVETMLTCTACGRHAHETCASPQELSINGFRCLECNTSANEMDPMMRGLVETRDKITSGGGLEVDDTWMTDTRSCQLCQGRDNSNTCGYLMPLDRDAWVHERCASWSDEVSRDSLGLLHFVSKSIARGQATNCGMCGKPGATLGCSAGDCDNSYHFPCAFDHCCFVKSGKVFCPDHVDRGKFKEKYDFSQIEKRPIFYVGNKFKRVDNEVSYRAGPISFDQIGNAVLSRELGMTAHGYTFPVGYKAMRKYWAPDGSHKRATYVCEITKGLNERGGSFPLFKVTCKEDASVQHISSSIAEVSLNVVGMINMYRSRLPEPKPDIIRLPSEGPNSVSPVKRMEVERSTTPSPTFAPSTTNPDVTQGYVPVTPPGKISPSVSPRQRTTPPSLAGPIGPYQTLRPLKSLPFPGNFIGSSPDAMPPPVISPSKSLKFHENLETELKDFVPQSTPETDFFFGLWFFGLEDPTLTRIILRDLHYNHHVKKEKVVPSSTEIVEGEVTHPYGCIRCRPFEKGNMRRMATINTTKSEKKRMTLTAMPVKAESFQFLPDAMQYRITKANQGHLRVVPSPVAQMGVFTTRPIAEGEMIIEYVGEIIRQHVADEREKMYNSKGLGCYMFRLNDYHIIDATVKGNKARFVNHSCDPNAATRIIDLGNGEERIMIVAIRPIVAGEEILYDYQFPYEDNSKMDWYSTVLLDINKMGSVIMSQSCMHEKMNICEVTLTFLSDKKTILTDGRECIEMQITFCTPFCLQELHSGLLQFTAKSSWPKLKHSKSDDVGWNWSDPGRPTVMARGACQILGRVAGQFSHFCQVERHMAYTLICTLLKLGIVFVTSVIYHWNQRVSESQDQNNTWPTQEWYLFLPPTICIRDECKLR